MVISKGMGGCNINNDKFMLGGMVYREGGIFIAASIDLALASQASSAKEALEKLESQIRSYLDEALSEHKYAYDLIKNRKAPMSWFMHCYFVKFRSFFSNKNNKTCDMLSTILLPLEINNVFQRTND